MRADNRLSRLNSMPGLILGCALLARAAVCGEAIEAKPGALRAWLLQRVDEATAARAAEIAKLKTPELIAARQKMLREKFIEAIGGFPERTPLNAAPKLFAHVTLVDEPPSWNDVLQKPGKRPYSDLIHGVFKEYDLADLKAALGEKVK